MRNAKVGKDSLFSKEVLYTLFLTNILSILLGAGVGCVNLYNLTVKCAPKNDVFFTQSISRKLFRTTQGRGQ